jgi:hypothetical protein
VEGISRNVTVVREKAREAVEAKEVKLQSVMGGLRNSSSNGTAEVLSPFAQEQ